MILSLIAAYAKDDFGARVIGKDNKLPWHFPHDLERFKEYTSGCAVIMGRKTYESIGRPLPNRTNVVVTRQRDYHPQVPKEIHVFNDLLPAIEFASQQSAEVFIIGGQQLYEQTIDRADRLYLTSFQIKDIVGDAYFPDYNVHQYKCIHLEQGGVAGDCFQILERKAEKDIKREQEEPCPALDPSLVDAEDVDWWCDHA